MDPRTRQNCQAKWQAASLCEDEDSACRLQLDWDDCNSLDQDSAPAVEPLLDEAIGGGEMLEEVFVVDIVDLYNVLLEGAEEGRVQWGAQDRDDVGNVCLLESLTSAKGEHAPDVQVQVPRDFVDEGHGADVDLQGRAG